MTKSSIICVEDRVKVFQLRAMVKEHISEYYDTDFNLLRWIQGHDKLPIREVAKKLKHHLHMRNCLWKLDGMHDKAQQHEINKYWVDGLMCTGNPARTLLFVEQCGRIDYSGMLKRYSLAEVMQARLPVLERLLHHVMESEKATGKQCAVYFVMDLTDLKYDKKLYDLVVGKMKALADFMAEHYVELIKSFVVLNAPSFVLMLWAAVKPLLPERTKAKVRMLSSNWRAEMRDICSEKICPKYWSNDVHQFEGHLALPEPFPPPEKPFKLEMPSSSNEHIIHAGKTMVMSIDCKKGDVLSYWFMANRDIGFGLFEGENGEKLTDYYEAKPLIPCFPCLPGPLEVPFEDDIKIPKDGVFTLIISNERSWFHSVKIWYKVEKFAARPVIE